MKFSYLFRKILRGQTLLRILMNSGFREFKLSGKVVDIGGGRHPDYFEYFDIKGTQSIEPLDGSLSGIDFERDRLPYDDGSIDTVVCANVLEHIYNHQLLVKEMHRILTLNGTLVGFVPFLIQYHPDPHDYFRYTKEALMRIFTDAGFKNIAIKEVGGGPFATNFNNIMLSIPRPLAAILFSAYWGLDRLFLKLRPKVRERYPLGFIFSMEK
jgi:SAM-dependent methyltransferase